MINKISLPIAIIISAVILGGFVFATQVIKSKSIERQQQIKIEEEWDKEGREVIRKIKQEREEREREEELVLNLNNCLYEATRKGEWCWYLYCKEIGEDPDKNCSLPHELAVRCNDIGKEAKEDCFKKYPQR